MAEASSDWMIDCGMDYRKAGIRKLAGGDGTVARKLPEATTGVNGRGKWNVIQRRLPNHAKPSIRNFDSPPSLPAHKASSTTNPIDHPKRFCLVADHLLPGSNRSLHKPFFLRGQRFGGPPTR